MGSKIPEIEKPIHKLENDIFNLSLVFSGMVVAIGATYLAEGKISGGTIICAIGFAWPVIVGWGKNTVKANCMGVEDAYAWGLKNLLNYDKVCTAIVGIMAISRIFEFFNK